MELLTPNIATLGIQTLTITLKKGQNDNTYVYVAPIIQFHLLYLFFVKVILENMHLAIIFCI